MSENRYVRYKQEVENILTLNYIQSLENKGLTYEEAKTMSYLASTKEKMKELDMEDWMDMVDEISNLIEYYKKGEQS